METEHIGTTNPFMAQLEDLKFSLRELVSKLKEDISEGLVHIRTDRQLAQTASTAKYNEIRFTLDYVAGLVSYLVMSIAQIGDLVATLTVEGEEKDKQIDYLRNLNHTLNQREKDRLLEIERGEQKIKLLKYKLQLAQSTNNEVESAVTDGLNRLLHTKTPKAEEDTVVYHGSWSFRLENGKAKLVRNVEGSEKNQVYLAQGEGFTDRSIGIPELLKWKSNRAVAAFLCYAMPKMGEKSKAACKARNWGQGLF